MSQANPNADRRTDDQPTPGADTGDAPDGAVLETRPTVKPAAIRLGATVGLGVLAILVLMLQPGLLGSPETTNVVLLIIQLLVAIAVVRLLIRIVILRRITYRVTPETVSREYELLMRRERQEVPHDLIRSVQYDQSRLETLLGYGSISINKGLGELAMPNLREPAVVHDRIQEYVETGEAEGSV